MTVEIVGPFEHYAVVVDGWSVPFLTAAPMNGGKIAITLDNRFGIDIDVAQSETLLPFIANCIAVALGYTAHPGCDGIDAPLPSTPMHRMYNIFTVEAEEAS